MITEPSFSSNFKLNKLTEKLILARKDGFEIKIVSALFSLIEEIKQIRNISTRAARKVAIELLNEISI